MRRRLVALAVVLAAAAAPVAVATVDHQTTTVAAEKVKYKSGPCLRLLPWTDCLRLI